MNSLKGFRRSGDEMDSHSYLAVMIYLLLVGWFFLSALLWSFITLSEPLTESAGKWAPSQKSL